MRPVDDMLSTLPGLMCEHLLSAMLLQQSVLRVPVVISLLHDAHHVRRLLPCDDQVPGDAAGGQVTIACQFNETASTEVQVTPAAVAQTNGTVRQSASNASPIDDLTDDFAAGDAAVQVPVSPPLPASIQSIK